MRAQRRTRVRARAIQAGSAYSPGRTVTTISGRVAGLAESR